MAGSTSSIQNLVLFVFLCISTSTAFSSFHGGKNGVVCNARERQALLKFMHTLNSSANVLPSWVGEDCCSWDGVTCNNKTAHVIKLSLFNATLDSDMPFTGEIDPSLLELKHLTHLDLSSNDFGKKPIPKFFGLFKKLGYLDLSRSGFGGTIPQELGNLSSLHYLDLSRNSYMRVDNLHWLSHLSSLRHLDMSTVNLSRASNWLQEINMLPSLSVLGLAGCQISDFPTLPYLNFTSLTSLDLSDNSISSKFPHWLVNLHDLFHLNLIYNYIKGPIPNALGRLCNLQNLNLEGNKMDGDLNGFLQVLSRCGMRNGVPSIRVLNLSYNNFSGTLLESLGQLWKLEYLDMANNALEGVISEAHFANLTRLFYLDMSSNSFVFNIGIDWIPPFQLETIQLSSCDLGPRFPMWLQHQKAYGILNLSNAQISDIIPHWFWNLSSEVFLINLSHNKIHGQIPNSLNFSGFTDLDLSWNFLKGPLPYNISNVITLDLSNNLFSGPIILSINDTSYFDLSKNYLNGSIPSSICEINMLYVLNLSDNGFTGQIPSCFNQLQYLDILDLSKNQLSGGIPIGLSYIGLRWLQLRYNKFSGGLPSSFGKTDYSFIEFMDLSQNRLSGSLPAWNSKNLSRLRILNLRSNMFHGNIPAQLLQLPSLQILDLSHNHLSGSIPTSFGNFGGMKKKANQSGSIVQGTYDYESYDEGMMMVMKGKEREYTKTLPLVATIDLSSNDLSGEIPEVLTSLYGLQSLNLSANQLEGKIPESIGKLRQLDSLDLSSNHLFGAIPASMEALSFLGSLNLSYNNLSGPIPSGNHLQTLFDDPSIYKGNRDLCGPPLAKACQEEVPQTPGTLGDGHGEEGVEKLWFFIGMAPGFVIGFWCIFGPVLFSKSGRITYYKFFDNLMNWIHSSL